LKRGAFIRKLTKAGCSLKRHGKKHDIYINSKNGKKAPVPRHSEIKETLCEINKKPTRNKIKKVVTIYIELRNAQRNGKRMILKRPKN